ncbi:hypothetical protein AAHE18_15G042600 [Arachis hypogaea]
MSAHEGAPQLLCLLIHSLLLLVPVRQDDSCCSFHSHLSIHHDTKPPRVK